MDGSLEGEKEGVERSDWSLGSASGCHTTDGAAATADTYSLSLWASLGGPRSRSLLIQFLATARFLAFRRPHSC